MHEARTFLQDLALVFCVATAATLVIQRLRQPVVLGYLVAGAIVGPNVPIPLFADAARIETLSELGVVLVMFSLGLEFSIERLARLLPTAGLAALVQITGMIWLGYLVGQLFGWGWPDSLFIGGMVCISSTMVVSRVFAASPVEPRLSDSVFGILVIQDLAVILLITVFTAVATGSGLPADEVARVVGELALFVAALLVAGILVVPRLIREADRRGSEEVLLVAAIGTCFGLALLAENFGYSVALGAFAGGMLVGESGRRTAVEHLITPLRDLFAAVFFVSIGMLVDPAAIADSWLLIVVLSALVMVGLPLFIALGSFLAGQGLRLSVRSGLSLAQIGEFSFILVGIGVAAGAVSPRLYAVAVTVAAVTAFTTPLFVRWSDTIALAIERRLPHPLQTFAALYEAWFESMRARRSQRARSLARRLWILFAVDAAVVVLAVTAAAAGHDYIAARLRAHLGVGRPYGAIIAIAGALAVALPFAIGTVRVARALGLVLAVRALPEREGKPGAGRAPGPAGERTVGPKVDLGAAPRRAFVVALQLALVSLVVFPLVAITQPFVPVYVGAAFLAVVLTGLGISFWRGTTNLHAHVRAGAELVLEVLGRQRQEDEAGEPSDAASAGQPGRESAVSVPALAEILPGLGSLTTRRIPPDSPVIGKTLAALHLRGLTGASVIAIQRPGGGVVSPTGDEALAAGDLISLTGSRAAIEAADELLGFAPAGDEASAGDTGDATGATDAPDVPGGPATSS